MLADQRTLDVLDFGRVRDRLVEKTRTQRGRVFAEEMLPDGDFAIVRLAQARTDAMRSLRAATDFAIMPAIETSALTQAAQLGRTLAPEDLRQTGEALAAAASAVNAVREHPQLAQVTSAYTQLRELQRAIYDAIDERGAVLDRASHALGKIRRNLVQAQADARDRMTSILNGAKYAKAIQDRVVTLREGRFVIPIKAEFAGTLPGIVHDTSSSGQTLFIEPLAALESNNRVRTLHLEEEREVQRILQALSANVGTHAAAIEANIEILAQLDVLAAKADLARAWDAMMPELSDEPCIAIDRGRHPLLDARAVPQSLTLDDDSRLLVISGPNMGGKTVALKMTGLFVALTYCGMQLPAGPQTRVGSFARVVADIGDEQSLVANASTFSAHLSRMREILEIAGPQTLAIVDEIGGGTEPNAGAALAIAMLECLLERGAKAVVSTHSTELKLFAHATPRIANASVRFDPHTFTPSFELDLGAPGQSLAFPLATRIGIDDEIVTRATALLEDRERDYESALAELASRNAELRDERVALQRERLTAEQKTAALRERERELDEQRRQLAASAEERMQQGLRDFVRELQRRSEANEATRSRRPRVTPGQSALLRETIAAVRKDLGITGQERREAAPQSFAPGDRVRIVSLDQPATVAEDWDDRLLVSVGSMKMTVDRGDVRPEGAAAPRKRQRTGGAQADARVSAAVRTSESLDVRGKRYGEAEPLVERWIDDALLGGTASLRLIHGKGTGMLGRGLQEYLRSHPAVVGFRYGNEEEGSTGVTIVDLRT